MDTIWNETKGIYYTAKYGLSYNVTEAIWKFTQAKYDFNSHVINNNFQLETDSMLVSMLVDITMPKLKSKFYDRPREDDWVQELDDNILREIMTEMYMELL